jgi:hypothetical protein
MVSIRIITESSFTHQGGTNTTMDKQGLEGETKRGERSCYDSKRLHYIYPTFSF